MAGSCPGAAPTFPCSDQLPVRGAVQACRCNSNGPPSSLSWPVNGRSRGGRKIQVVVAELAPLLITQIEEAQVTLQMQQLGRPASPVRAGRSRSARSSQRAWRWATSDRTARAPKHRAMSAVRSRANSTCPEASPARIGQRHFGCQPGRSSGSGCNVQPAVSIVTGGWPGTVTVSCRQRPRHSVPRQPRALTPSMAADRRPSVPEEQPAARPGRPAGQAAPSASSLCPAAAAPKH